MDAAAELGRNPVSKHQIQPGYGDEQTDAGRDGWTRLARPNSQARTGTREYSFSLFSWPRAGLATLPGWSILCYMGWPYMHATVVLSPHGNARYLLDGNRPLWYMLPWYSAPTVMHGIYWMVIGATRVHATVVLSPYGNARYFLDGNRPLWITAVFTQHRGNVLYILYIHFLGLLPRAWCGVAIWYQYVHRTRKSPDLELEYEIVRRAQWKAVSISQADIRSQQATITRKSYAPRCELLHHQTKAVKEPPSPLQITVSYGIILSHGHKSTATSAKRKFNTSILYTTKLRIHRFKTRRAVVAIAPSTCATFFLHRAAAALLASMAWWTALTSGNDTHWPCRLIK